MGSHAAALRSQGASPELADAVGTNNFEGVNVDPKDRALIKYVKLLTLKPADTKDDDVQAMRDAGFSDEQIWEVCVEVGIFSFLNRMADAYGLDYPTGGWFPPKAKSEKTTGTDTDN